LAISGGQTSLYRIQGLGKYEILGQTKDDAAGEAFDKFAKMIGLGFPGGARVDKESRGGKTDAFLFPRGLIHEDTFDMSFSGLKSASHRLLSGLSEQEILSQRANLCASFQEAVVDALMIKLDRAVEHCGYSRVILTGGVSANSRLRQRAHEWANQNGLSLVIPPLRYCTDNAAMIGYVGALRLARGERSGLRLAPSPSSMPDDFQQATKT
jgi:N6-L-threonylcarbamoyladenine synthase